jgi:negative elongation factor E
LFIGIDLGPKADAKEVAKKLLKSGAIAAIKAPERKDAGFMRKRVSLDRSIDRPGGYQPFSSSNSVEGESIDEPVSAPADPNPAPHVRPAEFSAKYNLYSNFVSAKDVETIAREETLRERKREGKAHYVNRDLPNQGNTVYVRGAGLTDPSLRAEFSMCGTIVQITIESEKSCAFVTFETIEEANKAIDALNGSTIDNVQVQVSLARKQPVIKQKHSSSSTSSSSDVAPSNTNSWTSIAANYYKEGLEKNSTAAKDNPRSRRPAIVYDDIDD